MVSETYTDSTLTQITFEDTSYTDTSYDSYYYDKPEQIKVIQKKHMPFIRLPKVNRLAGEVLGVIRIELQFIRYRFNLF